ncbi:DUF166 domain-containing protein [Candidatus Acetothermia bacterium]|jgi:thymidylate synthase|nr:DUF166 domain-containing protein [Candidatus Acetothermia bacterium]MCI2427335.1 DUF166 domain-containing protein [Candidatus Acetothermia bacterium]
MILQGKYGNRIVKTITAYMPPQWKLKIHSFPDPLPVINEDSLNNLLPKQLPTADLLLSLAEDSRVAELLPDMVDLSGATAVLAPVANRSWLPPGLANQIKRKLEQKNVTMVMPIPFCLLTETDSDNELIREFAQLFGRPRVKLKQEQQRIKQVTVLTDAPCGNTRFVAEKLVGTAVKDAYFQAGLLHHAHVCYATMVMDRQFNDTLMHRSGLAIKQAVAEAIKAINNR